MLDGVSLKNAHSVLHHLCTFEAESGGHFVTVEDVNHGRVSVINPDTRPTPAMCSYDAEEPCRCYIDGMWGRMTFKSGDTMRLMMGSTRGNGGTTKTKEARALRFVAV